MDTAQNAYTQAEQIVQTWLQEGDTTKPLAFTNRFLERLPPLPPTVEVLNLYRTRVKELPSLPPTLKQLYARRSHIHKLPPLPPSLTHLALDLSWVSALPPLPPLLEYLDIEETRICVLPPLPDSLKNLNITDTPIRHLPLTLPPNMETLHCYTNEPIYELPYFPPSMEFVGWNMDDEEEPAYTYEDGDMYRKECKKYIDILNKRTEKRFMNQSKERVAVFKKELVEKVFHPKNFERWLETGGDELVNMMMGI